MIRRAILAVAALALLVPAAAQADGVQFGFAGGTLSFAGLTLTTTPGNLPTFTDISRIPNGNAAVGSFGTVSFQTGSYIGSSGSGQDLYFQAIGSTFTITVNQAFSNLMALSGFSVAAGTNIFQGGFGDMTTSNANNWFIQMPGALSTAPSGTGAIWSSNPCPASIAGPGISCSRLVGALSGTLDPQVLAWLGLSGSSANGWVGQIDFSSDGQIYNIRIGDGVLNVPEPGTLLLFGTGLVAIAGVLRRKIVA